MGDEALPGAGAVEVVRAEDRHALGLQRDLERVGGDDHVEAVQGVGAEPVLEDGEHRRQRRELGHHVRAVGGGVVDGAGDPQRQFLTPVPADVGRDEVGRRRDGLEEGPRGAAGRGLPIDQVAGHHHRVALVGRELDAVGGLVRGTVVAREPRRCPGRLRGDQDAVGEFLPADAAPARGSRAGRAGVAQPELEPLAGGEFPVGTDGDPPLSLPEGGSPLVVEPDAADRQAHQVDVQRAGGRLGHPDQGRLPVQTVGGDAVTQLQPVLEHAVAGVATTEGVVVLHEPAW